MDWQKILSEMSLLSEKPISEGTLMMAMYLDLYKTTKNHELKEVIELLMIKLLKTCLRQ